MIENINNIYKRMKTIQSGFKDLNNFKPESLKNFENMYKDAISKNNNTITQNDVKIHPFLEEEKTDQDLTNKPNNRREMINDAIKKSSAKYKVSEDLIRAVIKVESNYNQYGVSKAGAMGLMQIIPKTALKLGIEKPFDIYENIDGGTRYLKMMLERYDGDLDKALAAYNAGPNRVDEANGIPNIDETINYVYKIKQLLLK